MDLSKLVGETLKNFDATKDKVNSSQFEQLPAGTYAVNLDNVGSQIYENSGYHCLQFRFEIIDGEYASRKEFMNISLSPTTTTGKPMPEFVVARNLKSILAVAQMVGLTLTDADFPNDENMTYQILTEKFRPYFKTPLMMHLTITENTKNPQYPYRNYEFSKFVAPTQQNSPLSTPVAPIEVVDEDVPF